MCVQQLATGWTNEESGFNFWQQTRDSALLQSAVTRLGPIQPPTQWEPAAKEADCEADHSPLSRAEFKNSWSNTSTAINAFMAQFLIKQRDFTCTLQTMVYWCTGSLVYWCTGILVLWCTAVLLHWCTGSLVYWFSGVLVYWCTGVLVLWCTGALVYWFSGVLVYSVQCTVY
jgi:hypothetical protein